MNFMHPPETCFGLRVMVHEDQPRVKLSTTPCVSKYGDVVEWVSPAMRAEIDAWALRFFGTTNLFKDGDYIVAEKAGFVAMNPRTLRQFRSAIAGVRANSETCDGSTEGSNSQ